MRNPAFIALLDEIRALHESKNHDYATDADPLSNLRRSEAFGIPAWKGVLVRLTDKWSRVEQLASGKTPKHESLRDSLLDNAVYSLLCIVLLEEQAAQSGYRPAIADAKTVHGECEFKSGPLQARCDGLSVQETPPFIVNGQLRIHDVHTEESEVVGVGPQGYVTAEHLRMSR